MSEVKDENSCNGDSRLEIDPAPSTNKEQSASLQEKTPKLTKTGVKRSLDDESLVSVSLRSSNREPRKRTLEASDKSPSGKLNHRQCGKSGCDATIPICFASVSERCCGSGYTSRWYHMSTGEHYCNECFEYFYRSYKDGYSQYLQWKKHWSANSRLEPSLKAFMADQMLPYWVQCTQPTCRKWRQLSKDANLTPDFLSNFNCRMSGQKKDEKSCQVPEDSRVAAVISPCWIESLTLPALLTKSPAAQYLHEYFCDGVGLSPTSFANSESQTNGTTHPNGGSAHKIGSSASETTAITTCGRHSDCRDFLQPFYQPAEQRKALCIRPDVMEADEMIEFSEYQKEQAMYLGVRNLVIALWNLNPKDWLTIEKVSSNLICRGLVRIRCTYEAERVLAFLSKKGAINFGFVQCPPRFYSFSQKCREQVIVIGAGASGLACARHLGNLGLKVIVLEASNRIGGRIWDENSFGGVCVGRGAQIVTGVINNPITVICRQAGIQMWIIGEKCDLFNDSGQLPSPDSDQRVDFHFNAILDAIADWRKNQQEDVNLLEKLYDMHQTFLEETEVQFSQEEENLLHFHVSNLEYACGVNLKEVSSLSWDQNEQFPQFAGHHTLLPCGYSALVTLLATGLDIRLNQPVTKVDYNDDDLVTVTTAEGKQFQGTKVVVTVPLAVLQQTKIDFFPSLPERKVCAFDNLGAGVIEKIGLQFPCRFWERKLQGADLFGHIPSSSSERGLFSVFYDLTLLQKSRPKSAKRYVLMSYVSGDSVTLLHEKTDVEVVELCLINLRKIFSDEDTPVPEPISWFVTRWKTNPYAGMAYSYIRVGGSGEAYDQIAEPVDDKLYFAGEATNRQFPQTVTGAYLSGIREAYKIARTVEQQQRLL